MLSPDHPAKYPAIIACVAMVAAAVAETKSNEVVLPITPAVEVTMLQDAMTSDLGSADTLVIESKFAGKLGEALDLQVGNLIVRSPATFTDKMPVIFLNRMSLNIEKDIQVESGAIEVEGGSLVWGGTAIFESTNERRPASLNVYPGSSKVEGGELVLSRNSVINLHFFDQGQVSRFTNSDSSKSKPIQLNGKLELGPGVKLRVKFLGQAGTAPLPSGDYTLIRAAEVIGDAPAITQIEGIDNMDLPKFSCIVRDSQLILSVAP